MNRPLSALLLGIVIGVLYMPVEIFRIMKHYTITAQNAAQTE